MTRRDPRDYPNPPEDANDALARIACCDAADDLQVQGGLWVFVEVGLFVTLMAFGLWTDDIRPLIAMVACSIINMQQQWATNERARILGWLDGKAGFPFTGPPRRDE